MPTTTKKKSSKKSTATKKKTKSSSEIFSDKYRPATELDFQMNASYLVRNPRGDEFDPVETWPGENDSLSKQAIKYSGLVSRGLIVIKK